MTITRNTGSPLRIFMRGWQYFPCFRLSHKKHQLIESLCSLYTPELKTGTHLSHKGCRTCVTRCYSFLRSLYRNIAWNQHWRRFGFLGIPIRRLSWATVKRKYCRRLTPSFRWIFDVDFWQIARQVLWFAYYSDTPAFQPAFPHINIS